MNARRFKNDRELNRALKRIDELWSAKSRTPKGDERDVPMLRETLWLRRYDQYKTNVDFIKRYIFPGGCCSLCAEQNLVALHNPGPQVCGLADIELKLVPERARKLVS